MKRVLVIFGTRPEAIKLAPVITRLRAHPNLTPTVCFTGQHGREMVDPILDFFSIEPEIHLEAMQPNQSLGALSAALFDGLAPVFERVRPEAVIVQGDTTSSLIGALLGYYHQTAIGHIEAGLRTGALSAPFPEEGNRQIISRLANLHFAPTERAANVLRAENLANDHIIVTGNTVIDALLYTVARNDAEGFNAITALWPRRKSDREYVLVTLHRREAFGEIIRDMMFALVDITNRHPDIDVVLLSHPNPNVLTAIEEVAVAANHNLKIVPPQPYRTFVGLMSRARLILTDSGGVQEEAPSLDRPVLVLRDRTERTEGIDAGCLVKVGTDRAMIVEACENLLTDAKAWSRIASAHNPYGDGNASSRICDNLAAYLRA